MQQDEKEEEYVDDRNTGYDTIGKSRIKSIGFHDRKRLKDDEDGWEKGAFDRRGFENKAYLGNKMSFLYDVMNRNNRGGYDDEDSDGGGYNVNNNNNMMIHNKNNNNNNYNCDDKINNNRDRLNINMNNISQAGIAGQGDIQMLPLFSINSSSKRNNNNNNINSIDSNYNFNRNRKDNGTINKNTGNINANHYKISNNNNSNNDSIEINNDNKIIKNININPNPMFYGKLGTENTSINRNSANIENFPVKKKILKKWEKEGRVKTRSEFEIPKSSVSILKRLHSGQIRDVYVGEMSDEGKKQKVIVYCQKGWLVGGKDGLC